jgi:hypothetical protein
MTQTIVFDPLIPWPALWGLAALGALALALALWRGLSAAPLRALALLALGFALAGPMLQSEERRSQSDIVIALADESDSQALSDRSAQNAAALANLRAEVAALENTELREVRFSSGAGDTGTQAMAALSAALAAEPAARIAAAFLITDGLVHDAPSAPPMPAPFHVLQTGKSTDWDRRLIITNAPAFGILGEELRLGLRIEDEGTPPAGTPASAEITISADTDAPVTFTVPVGQDLELPLRLPHAGINVLQLSLPEMGGEMTARNNAAVVQISGVRDRLRVLLVSGEPHAGERMWRNLLKSDPSVDLVHFTILRPPEKQDGVPTEELALIAFPTRELFVEKVNEFDLIIFDRFAQQGLLPTEYLQSVVQYVLDGGTVLVSAGPEYGMVDSLWRSPLAQILPAEPTSRVIEQGFRPALTDIGRRHPVTEGLAGSAETWGRWFRMVEVTPLSGQVVMSGPDDRPLLVLDRVGEGRIAVLASDHVWLWGRGFEGGGPQLDLLRRLAHWMLKEPELEEESLNATARDTDVTITRRSLAPNPPGPLTITAPDGTAVQLTLTDQGAGRYSAVWRAPQVGLYRLAQDGLQRVVAVGTSLPRELAQVVANPAALQPLVAQTRGGVWRIEDGAVDLRSVREGRAAAGRGWLGITPRGAYLTEGLRIAPLLPPVAWLAIAAALMIAAWGWEGRRRPRLT